MANRILKKVRKEKFKKIQDLKSEIKYLKAIIKEIDKIKEEFE